MSDCKKNVEENLANAWGKAALLVWFVIITHAGIAAAMTVLM